MMTQLYEDMRRREADNTRLQDILMSSADPSTREMAMMIKSVREDITEVAGMMCSSMNAIKDSNAEFKNSMEALIKRLSDHEISESSRLASENAVRQYKERQAAKWQKFLVVLIAAIISLAGFMALRYVDFEKRISMVERALTIKEGK